MIARLQQNFTSRPPARDQHDEGEERRQILQSLLDQWDAAAEADDRKQRRTSVRIKYRRSSVPVRIFHPGGSAAFREVITRDLSSGGISFAHQGYLHVNTYVEVVLTRGSGAEDVVRGTTVYCRHVSGPYHLVGVKFISPIEPKLYLDPDQAGGLDGPATDPKLVHGRLLLLDDLDVETRLFAFHLRHTNVEVVGCTTLEDARAHLRSGGFDLVVTDLNLPEAAQEATATGLEVMEWLRREGYHGRIAICTTETDEATLQRVREADVVGLLRKPYTGEKLLSAVANWLTAASSAALPIYSPLCTQPEMRPLVLQYVRQVQSFGHALGPALRDAKLDTCRAICSKLRSTGGSFGFPELTDAAAKVIQQLDETGSLQQSLSQLRRVQDICSRIVAEPPIEPGVPARAG